MENADYLEIYPGSTLEHFRSLSKKPGIPCSGILFLDDESRNREVWELGVHFKLATTEAGFFMHNQCETQCVFYLSFSKNLNIQ